MGIKPPITYRFNGISVEFDGDAYLYLKQTETFDRARALAAEKAERENRNIKVFVRNGSVEFE